MIIETSGVYFSFSSFGRKVVLNVRRFIVNSLNNVRWTENSVAFKIELRRFRYNIEFLLARNQHHVQPLSRN